MDQDSSIDKGKITGEGTENSGRSSLTKGDIAKFALLIILFILSIAATVYFWPTLRNFFTEDGRENLISLVQNFGLWGVVILFCLELFQVIFAFIPGEVVQIVAGILYGPLFGSLIIIAGALLSTVMVYCFVHFLASPMIEKMISEEKRSKYDFITRTKKINLIVFIIFLIPAIPKDFLTYFVALSDIRPQSFFLYSTLGRIPAIIASTFIGDSFAEGNWVVLFILFACVLVIFLICYLQKERILSLVHKISKHHEQQSHKTSDNAEVFCEGSSCAKTDAASTETECKTTESDNALTEASIKSIESGNALTKPAHDTINIEKVSD